MAKSNYYSPSKEPIRLVPGVKYQQWGHAHDVYIGEADALIRSGVVQEHMLPALGHCTISWRAQGAKLKGRSANWEPGFTTIRRMPTGTAWRVEVVVCEEERQAREAATERKRAQDPEAQARLQKKKEEEERTREYRSNPESLRENVTFFLNEVIVRIAEHTPGWGTPNERRSYASRFPHIHDEAFQEGLEALQAVQEWLRRVPISPLSENGAAPRTPAKGHLRLVHSA